MHSVDLPLKLLQYLSRAPPLFSTVRQDMIASPLAALHCHFDAGLWANSGSIKSFPLLIHVVRGETIIAGDHLDAGSLSWDLVFLPVDKLSLLPLCEKCLPMI